MERQRRQKITSEESFNSEISEDEQITTFEEGVTYYGRGLGEGEGNTPSLRRNPSIKRSSRR